MHAVAFCRPPRPRQPRRNNALCALSNYVASKSTVVAALLAIGDIQVQLVFSFVESFFARIQQSWSTIEYIFMCGKNVWEYALKTVFPHIFLM